MRITRRIGITLNWLDDAVPDSTNGLNEKKETILRGEPWNNRYESRRIGRKCRSQSAESSLVGRRGSLCRQLFGTRETPNNKSDMNRDCPAAEICSSLANAANQNCF